MRFELDICAVPSDAAPAMNDLPSIGLALGGGGVRGLAHVAALETIDELGLTPSRIAGTSMGAILGAIYASGKPGSEIRSLVERYTISKDDGLRDVYQKKEALLRWLKAVTLAWSSRGLLKADGFLRFLFEEIKGEDFEDLKIPLSVVATDYHSGRPVVFDSGPLYPAIKASMSIPGIFVPVEHEGRVLVDGGVVDNLPYDVLAASCDVTIALDASPSRSIEDADPPNMIDATLGMFDLLVAQLTAAKLDARPPTIYFKHCLPAVGILEFDKGEEVLERSREGMDEFRELLESSARHL